MNLNYGCDMSKKNKVEDPVCKMNVDSGTLAFNYRGIEYSFCSQQCHERFSSNPQLYIGLPGRPAPKQHDMHVIKRRVLKLNEIIPEDVAVELETALKKMMGIKEVTIDKKIIHLTYDLLEVTSEQIEMTIKATGKKLAADWGEKFKRAFTHYFEETELDTMEETYKLHKSCHE